MKQLIRISILFTLILTIPASIFAQLDRSTPPEPGPAPEIQLGESHQFRLDNGLRVILVENHEMPLVNFSLNLDIPPVAEGEAAGYVQIVGDLLRAGTTNRTKEVLDSEIDFIGASVYTSSTNIYASALSKDAETLLELVADMTLNSTFPEEEMEKSKKQLLSGLAASKTNPDAIAGNVGNVLCYGPEHPYGEIVTEESIEHITIDKCRNYYQNYFSPNQAYLIMVGDITPEKGKELAQKYFSRWSIKDVPSPSYTRPQAPEGRRVAFVHRDGAVQSVIKIIYPVDLQPGSNESIPASIANAILGAGSFSARLIQNLREDKAYTYGAYSRLNSDEEVGHFTASAKVRNEVTDSAVTQFLYEMERMVNEPVSDNELELAINARSGKFALSLENAQTIARFAYNAARFNLPDDYYNTYLQKLSNVTVQKVQEMAKRYIKPENCYILVVGNKEIAPKLAQFSATGEVEFYDNYGRPIEAEAKEIPEGVTAETVINDYLEAIGGHDKLEDVKYEKVSMTADFPQGEMKINTYKDGKRFKMTLFVGTTLLQKQVYDGKDAVNSSMGQTEEITGEELEKLQLNVPVFSELHYAEQGYETELVEIETVNGKDAYKLKVTSPFGDMEYNYFDTESGMKIMTKQIVENPETGETMEINIQYKDFKEVSGITYPHTIVRNMMGQDYEFTVKEIDIENKIDKKTFDID